MNVKRISNFFMLILVSTVTLTFFLQNSVAQDYTQINLPEGAKARLGKGTISEIAYSPDGTRLAVGGSIGVWIYDVQSGKELALLTEHTSRVTSVAFSPDGKTLATGDWDGTARLWDVDTTTLIHEFTAHNGRVYSVAFSPDGKTLATGGEDGNLRLWDVDTTTLIHEFTAHNSRVYKRRI